MLAPRESPPPILDYINRTKQSYEQQKTINLHKKNKCLVQKHAEKKLQLFSSLEELNFISLFSKNYNTFQADFFFHVYKNLGNRHG